MPKPKMLFSNSTPMEKISLIPSGTTGWDLTPAPSCPSGASGVSAWWESKCGWMPLEESFPLNQRRKRVRNFLLLFHSRGNYAPQNSSCRRSPDHAPGFEGAAGGERIYRGG